MGEVFVLGEHSEKIGSGATPRGGKETYLEHGPFSLIRSQNVYNHGFEFGGLAYISEEQAEKLSNVAVESGDVLVNITGDSVARVCQVHKHALPARVNQHVAIVRPNPKAINADFLRYWFVAPRTQATLLGLASAGATRNALTKSMLQSLEVPRFDLDTQEAIANVLSALDDKIELNRRTNETLEAMAQAIFKDWFVDFGPVRRKQAGETDPTAILGGLIPPSEKATQTAALFPDTFGDNGLPKGWAERPFSEFVEIVGGGTPKTSVEAYWGGSIPWYSVVDTPSGSDVFVFETHKNITPEGEAKSSVRLVQPNTTIISARGTVGNLAMAGVEMTFNQSCYGLLPAKHTGPTFVYLATQHIVRQLQQMAHGSVFSTITRQTFENITFAEASPKLYDCFESQILPIFEKIRSNVKENQTLAQTRDYLLPKLMSGQIRAGEFESMVA